MKIGIVGSGLVGATAAYAMVMNGVGREIILVDKNMDRARAEADDLLHAVPFAYPLHVRAGNYEDLAGSVVVVLTAGVNQQPGETRLQLLSRNAAIYRELVTRVIENAPGAVMVVATNPVDVMTHLTAHFAAEHGISSRRVVGSGTMLDTARLRSLLGQRLGVDSQHVHCYVVGEHGDSEVLTWSLITIGGMPLEDFCRQQHITLDDQTREQIDEGVRQAAYHIIAGKGATYYGIGSALARIVDVILHDQRAVLTVCTPVDEIAGVEDVTISLPHLLGGNGILSTFPLPLSSSEQAALHHSAGVVKEAITSLEL